MYCDCGKTGKLEDGSERKKHCGNPRESQGDTGSPKEKQTQPFPLFAGGQSTNALQNVCFHSLHAMIRKQLYQQPWTNYVLQIYACKIAMHTVCPVGSSLQCKQYVVCNFISAHDTNGFVEHMAAVCE